MKKSIYEKNLKALDEFNPEIKQWLDEEENINWISPLNSIDKKRTPNLLIESGAKRFEMYSLEAPLAEIKEVITHLSVKRRDATIIIGMGLGHFLNQLFQKAERGHKAIIVEPVRMLVKEALKLYDFSDQFRKKEIFICPSKDDVSIVLNYLEETLYIEEWNLITEPYTLNRQEYTQLIASTQSVLNQIRCNSGTVSSAGGKIAANDIECLPYLIKHRGINELKDLFKNKPAVVVSTGPSLKRNIHHLKEHREKIIIVAVAQALRILLAYDIEPDFICTVDFGEPNLGHFKGLMDSRVPLVVLNRTYAPLVAQYQGPKFVVETPVDPMFKDTAQSVFSGYGTTEQGGSVAHLALGFSRLLGCSPIMLIGQDLSLTDGKSHNAQADVGGEVELIDGVINWKVKDPRSDLNTKYEDGHSMGMAVPVEGYWGEPVYTNQGLASFITAFENIATYWKAANWEGELINCTEGGARLRGFKNRHLIECLKSLTEIIQKDELKKYLTPNPEAEKKLEEALKKVEYDIGVLKSIRGKQEKAVADYQRCKIFSENNPKTLPSGSRAIFEEMLRDSSKSTMELAGEAFKNPLVWVAIYGAQRELNTAKFGDKVQINDLLSDYTKWVEQWLIGLKRNKHILDAVKEAVNMLLPIYENSFELLKNREIDPKPENYQINLDDADNYFNAGNFAHPLLDARRINDEMVIKRAENIKQHIIQEELKREEENIERESKLLRFNEYMEDSLKAGREKDFETAYELLDKASQLFPDNQKAGWGKASALFMLKRHDEADKEFKRITSLWPDVKRFQFEAGQNLLVWGIIEKQGERIADGLTIILNAMKDTQEFDSFMSIIGNMAVEGGWMKEAQEFYKIYVDRFPADIKARKRYVEVLKKNNVEKEIIDEQENLIRKMNK